MSRPSRYRLTATADRRRGVADQAGAAVLTGRGESRWLAHPSTRSWFDELDQVAVMDTETDPLGGFQRSPPGRLRMRRGPGP